MLRRYKRKRRSESEPGPSHKPRPKTYDVLRLLHSANPAPTPAFSTGCPQLFRHVTNWTRYTYYSTPTRPIFVVSYHLDATDTSWLNIFNAQRERIRVLPPINEEQFERVMEKLEFRTWDVIQYIMKSDGIRVEGTENVKCDVCRSPDTDGLVCCGSCGISLHRACYGITDEIPNGQWLCSPCSDGVSQICFLCPNRGGGMKLVPPEDKWVHKSCHLWINSFRLSRTSRTCMFCDNREGLCIRCSVRSCNIAYHVTCAIKHKLEMRAIMPVIEDFNAVDTAKCKSFCEKHSLEKAWAARLQQIEKGFYKFVTLEGLASELLDVDVDAIISIGNYWKKKRRAGHNRPLLPPDHKLLDFL